MKINSTILYAPCPCGSGNKFKFCCLEKVRDELPFDPTQSQVTEIVRRAMMPGGKMNGVDFDDKESSEAYDLMIKGSYLSEDGFVEQAILLFRKARELQPKLFSAWDFEAANLWESGHYEEAVKTQKEGLSYASDINIGGWALLADFQYYLGKDEESSQSISRAMAILPKFEQEVKQVCYSLALHKRHEDILKYIEKSGFADSPELAYYRLVAGCNISAKIKSIINELNEKRKRQDAVAKENQDSVEIPKTVYGEFPYIDIEKYKAGIYAGRAMAERRTEHENVVCDLLEIMLNGRNICKKDALEALESFNGHRANRLRDWLATSDDFDERCEEFQDYESSGDEIVAQKVLAELGFDIVEIDECAGFGETFDEAEFERFRKCSNSYNRKHDVGSKNWMEMREEIKDIYERNPTSSNAGFIYVTLLEAEGNVAEIKEVVSKHPEYAYARARLVRFAIKEGNLDKAEKLVSGYYPPAWLSSREYLEWLNAKLAYYHEINDFARAVNTQDAIERVENMDFDEE